MITAYDYGIIASYLIFMVATGLVFRRMSKNTSDYFRASGAMPWWLTGTSAWIASFSAWTFTGAAGKVYETGTLVLVVFWATSVAMLFVYAYTCRRFRRMRVVTWMEAVRQRFDGTTEQFYTWIKVPLAVFFAGVGLNAIGVFMSSVFHVEMSTVLVVLGIIVTVVAFTGGAWAVLASDFVQMFLVMTITICTAVLVLMRPEIDGLSGLFERVPSAHFNWTELARAPIIAVWAMTIIWFKFSDQNTMENSTMYLMAQSDRDARRMVLIPLIGSLVGPLIWFIPSMAATILHPNLAAEYSQLKQPHEAAFVAVALDVMPQGLLGLLLCAMLGATVTSMDAGLNKAVGVFIRCAYLPILNPKASERHLLAASKIATLTCGALVIVIALLVDRFRSVGLFDFVNQLAANLLMPLALPLLFGLFVQRTPRWAAWSTALVASSASWLFGHFADAATVQRWMGWDAALTPRESTDLLLATTTFGTVAVGTLWFFFTRFFYEASPADYKARNEKFFVNLRTPIEKEDEAGSQTAIYRLLGLLSLVYGIFIMCLAAIPNSSLGRLCFLFCGGSIALAGAILFAVYLRRNKAAAVAGAPVAV